MNNFKFKILIVVSCLLFVVSSAQAKSSIDLTTAGVGARSLAMGRAHTAVADDINTIFSNPAGLGLQKTWGLTSMSTKLLGRVDYRMAGGVYPTEWGTFGVGYWSVMTPAGYLTTDKGSLSTASAINYGSSVVMLSYGSDLNDVIRGSSSLGKLAVGMNYKIISNRFEGVDGSGTGSSADFGMVFKPNAKFSGGINLKNLGGAVAWKNDTKENIPMSTNLGGSLKLGKTLVAVDIEPGGIHGGVEFKPFDILSLRAGVDHSNLTGGVGLRVNGFSFDYAYRQDSGLAENSSHYFSISFQPGVKDEGGRTKDEDQVKSIQLPKTDGVYRIVKKVEKKDILSYYE